MHLDNEDVLTVIRDNCLHRDAQQQHHENLGH